MSNNLPKGFIWVKVIRANPLSGPCVGQVQFLVDWTQRKFQYSANMDSLTVSYKGKKHRAHSLGNFGIQYVQVYENFTLTCPTSLTIDWFITLSNGEMFSLKPFLSDGISIKANPVNVSWTEAIGATPPLMRKFRIFLGDSNNRCFQGDATHWDAGILCQSLIGKYFKPYWARQASVEGDNISSFASVYKSNGSDSNEECYTLYVE